MTQIISEIESYIKNTKTSILLIQTNLTKSRIYEIRKNGMPEIVNRIVAYLDWIEVSLDQEDIEEAMKKARVKKNYTFMHVSNVFYLTHIFQYEKELPTQFYLFLKARKGYELSKKCQVSEMETDNERQEG